MGVTLGPMRGVSSAMIDGLSVLALILARGGSAGLARKNLRQVAGRSLLARAVDAAKAAVAVDRVILSSDEAEIIQAALRLGCEVPFVRPAELATAEARSIDVLRHAIGALPERHDLIVLVQPTSPLRRAADIDAALRLCVASGAPACVSISAVDKPPEWTYRLDDRGALAPVLPDPGTATRRQDLPAAYAVNGAVYVARRDWILENDSFVSPATVGYVMPKERSLDVDDELDLILAEAVAAHLNDMEPDAEASAQVAAAGGPQAG